jgi:hypothetical protein
MSSIRDLRFSPVPGAWPTSCSSAWITGGLS